MSWLRALILLPPAPLLSISLHQPPLHMNLRHCFRLASFQASFPGWCFPPPASQPALHFTSTAACLPASLPSCPYCLFLSFLFPFHNPPLRFHCCLPACFASFMPFLSASIFPSFFHNLLLDFHCCLPACFSSLMISLPASILPSFLSTILHFTSTAACLPACLLPFPSTLT